MEMLFFWGLTHDDVLEFTGKESACGAQKRASLPWKQRKQKKDMSACEVHQRITHPKAPGIMSLYRIPLQRRIARHCMARDGTGHGTGMAFSTVYLFLSLSTSYQGLSYVFIRFLSRLLAIVSLLRSRYKSLCGQLCLYHFITLMR